MGRARTGPGPDTDPIEAAFAIHWGELLDRSGRTIEEIAADVGRTRANVEQWLRADRMPPWKLLPKIAAALKLKKVSQLITTTFDPPTLEATE